MKILNRILAAVCALSVLIILLFNAVDIASLKDREFYRQQYIKNDTYGFVDITEKDLMQVTDRLIDYMCGKAESLDMVVLYNGEKQEFFDETEKAHMVDVRNLMVAGINIRYGLIGVVVISVLWLKFNKCKVMYTLSKAYIAVMATVSVIGTAAVIYISTDFRRAFWLFHEVLFTNNLWILDVNISKLVNMVPEPFFIAMAQRIAIYFALAACILLIMAVYIVKTDKKTQR